MDEGSFAPQVTTPKSKVPIIIAAAIIVIVAIVAFAIFGKPSFDAAEYMPSDVAMAVTMDLTSSQGKDAARSYIEGILKDAGIKDYQKEMFGSINKEYKIDVQKDVLPRLNGLGGIAILSQMSGFTPDAVFVVGTKSSSDAAELIKLFTSKQTKATKNTYEGFEYYNLSASPQPGFIGAINNAVVISSTTSAYTSVVDTIKKKKKNLVGNADFKKLRKSGGDVFAVTYFSGPNFYKMISPMMAMGAAQAPPGTMDSFKQNLENLLVGFGNAEADAKGIHYKFKGMTKEEQPTAPVFSINELVKGVPADAGFMASASGFDKLWKDGKANIMKNPAAKTQYDELANQLKQMLNIDLDKDIMDNIKSFSFYLVPKGNLASESLPLSFVFVFDTKDPVAMSKTLEKVHSTAAMMDYAQFKPLAISGSGVSSASVAVLKDGSMQIADAISGSKLVFVMSVVDAKGNLISALSSKGGISEATSFKKFSDRASDKCSSLVYGDVSKFMNAFSVGMPAQDKKKVDAIMKKVGVFGITSTSSGKQTESALEIPFLN